jgi:hypothetical protein
MLLYVLISFGAVINIVNIKSNIVKTTNQMNGNIRKNNNAKIKRNITRPIRVIKNLAMGFLTSLLFIVTFMGIHLIIGFDFTDLLKTIKA